MIAKPLKSLRSKCGAAMFKAIMILMILMIIVSFLFQIFVIYSTANSVRIAVQDAVLSVAAANKPNIFQSLREGNTSVTDEIAASLLTTDELSAKLCTALGLSQDGTILVREGAGGSLYTIKNMTVTPDNTYSRDKEITLSFVTEFELEIPIAQYWNFGSISIPMRIHSQYTSKF